MAQPWKKKCGKKLLGYALDLYYVFDDDEIENQLDIALKKFEKKPKWRQKVRAYMFSNPVLRDKIYNIATKMFGEREK